ncbi:TonB-dependent receptor [Sphingomonas elodea]|uniref:TonB-dependent receptor n=1 Tax=Sphingomonas elodea TaxID=179878 RepID=UPI001ED960EF|nr:TonB-dependent receptor [Sphingomonas elodea]
METTDKSVQLFRIANMVAMATTAFYAPQSFAQASGGGTAGLDGSQSRKIELADIVVTAQRRGENGQRVPVAIQTVTGEAIRDAGYSTLTDLQYLTPGLQYDPTQGAAFQIRGVGTTSFDFSNAKSVNVVVDDVVMDGQRANGLIGLADLAHADVLMGPQGTAFGKNSTSGVIAITTNKPLLNTTSVQASASFGAHNDRILHTTVNLPLGDRAALRITGFDQGQDGFGRNVTLNKLVGSTHDYGGRARLLVQPNDRFDLLVSGDYGHHWDSNVRTPVSGQPAAVTATLGSLGVTPGPRNADTADGIYGQLDSEEWGASVRVHAKIGNHDLTSISAYRYTRYNNDTPANLTPIDRFAYVPYNVGDLHTDKVSQEFHIASPEGGPVQYLIGLFYNRLEATQTQLQWATLGAPVFTNGTPTRTLFAFSGAIGATGNASLFRAVNETAATFGEIRITPTRWFHLNLGARYSHDDNAQGLDYVTVDPVPVIGFAPSFVPTSAPPERPFGRVTGDDFSFRISPTFQIAAELMAYGTYTTGYKPAGIAFVGNIYDPFSAETVKAWEVGLKSEWFGRRLRVNIDLFRSDFTNFQATILTRIPDGAGGSLLTTAIGNAGGLRSQGVETSIAARPTASLSLTASASYTDAYFTDYRADATTNYTNTRLPNSPAFSATTAATYEHALSTSLRLRAHADYAYRSGSWTVVGQPGYSYVPAFGLTNVRVSILHTRSGTEMGVYARNLFDTYFSTGWQIYGAIGLLHYTSPNARRTVGGFVSVNF